MATNLVTLHSGEPVTTTAAIADGTGNPHASVIKLVRRHKEDLEEFGPLGFEIRVANRPQGGGSKAAVAILNEPQATYLLTLMRNNDIVKAFKKALVKAFFELRQREQDRAELDATISIDKDEYIDLLRAKVQFLEGNTRKKTVRPPLTSAERSRIKELAALGWSNGEIATEVGCSKATVSLTARDVREVQHG